MNYEVPLKQNIKCNGDKNVAISTKQYKGIRNSNMLQFKLRCVQTAGTQFQSLARSLKALARGTCYVQNHQEMAIRL